MIITRGYGQGSPLIITRGYGTREVIVQVVREIIYLMSRITRGVILKSFIR